jgi:hypothetical protein
LDGRFCRRAHENFDFVETKRDVNSARVLDIAYVLLVKTSSRPEVYDNSTGNFDFLVERFEKEIPVLNFRAGWLNFLVA